MVIVAFGVLLCANLSAEWRGYGQNEYGRDSNETGYRFSVVLEMFEKSNDPTEKEILKANVMIEVKLLISMYEIYMNRIQNEHAGSSFYDPIIKENQRLINKVYDNLEEVGISLDY